MKKKISFLTLMCLGVSALIAILALFGFFKLKGMVTDLLFTFLTLTVAGLLTINSCEMLERKNKLAFVSLSLISLSSLLVILSFWTTLDNSAVYTNVTLVTSILSICFNLISSSILKMGKNYKFIQAISYICYSIVSILLALAFLSIIELNGTILKLFILFVICSLVAMCMLSILSKKHPTIQQENKKYIKITKEEYENLLNQKQQLEQLLKEKNSND